MVDRGAMTPNISIHAPARGATAMVDRGAMTPNISIHAPTGERHIFSVSRIEYRHFNPRSHGGSDKGIYQIS